MSAVGAGGKFDVDIALFPQSDQCVGAMNALHGAFADGAAFIQDHFQMNAVIVQIIHGHLSAGAGVFFGAGAEDIQVAVRGHSLGNQLFECFKKAAQAALDVNRAAAPQNVVDNFTAKGIMLPFSCGIDYIHMTHEQNTLFVRIAAFPF